MEPAPTPPPEPTPQPQKEKKAKKEKALPPPIIPRMIVGLGNPGRKYSGTRHNIGFDCLDHIARETGTEFKTDVRHQAHTAKTPSGILLVKPQTFMNESGRSVGSLSRFFKIPAQEILIIYDDVSLKLGILRFREKGSAGGHNGIKSLIAHLSTQEIPRLKIGVGGSAQSTLVSHVLGKFSTDEQDQLQNTLATVAQAVQLALSQGLAAAANVYNVRKKQEESTSDES